MARIDHTNCLHPRTPAGRAACRKAGIGQEAADIAPLSGAKATRVPNSRIEADCPGGDGHDDHMALNGECPWCGAGKAAEMSDGDVDALLLAPAPKRPRKAATRALKAPHDLADVPHAFGSVIRWAWEAGFEVRTANPYNDTERRVEITSEHGWLTLVWKAATPNGINGSFWRPQGSSVTSKLMSVNVGIDRLKGEWE
jgi:hypothetical protein